MKHTPTQRPNSPHGWTDNTREISCEALSYYLDRAVCDWGVCGDECTGECELGVLSSAYDLRNMFEYNVTIIETHEEGLCGPKFPRLTASISGVDVASVSGYWDLAEGLSALLADVNEGSSRIVNGEWVPGAAFVTSLGTWL